MTDIIQQLDEWLKTEPNQSEVILIRRKSGQFAVRIEYGDRTAVPFTGNDLRDVMGRAIDQAARLPSSQRKSAGKKGRSPSMPGMVTPSAMPGG